MLPLYLDGKTLYEELKLNGGNTGLMFDKYVDTWSTPIEKTEATKKEEFFKEFKKIDNDDLLKDYLKRRRELVVKKKGKILRAKTASRFVIGLGSSHPYETGMLFHRTLGRPYIPGSSLKGMMRAWADPQGWGNMEKNQVEELFGSQQGVGQVIVLEAIPAGTVDFELDIMNPHYSKYYGEPKEHPPADYYKPILIYFLTVKADTWFEFALIPNKNASENALQTATTLMINALQTIGAGSKTAVGYGYFNQVEDITESIRQEDEQTRQEDEQTRQEREIQRLQEEMESRYSGLPELVADVQKMIDNVEEKTIDDLKSASKDHYWLVEKEGDLEIQKEAARLLRELWQEIDEWSGKLNDKQQKKVRKIKEILGEK